MREQFGYATRMLSAEEVRSDSCDEREQTGAMFEPEGVGVHPLKPMFGLIRKARVLGVKIHTSSPVQGWETKDGVHYLRTPGGTVRAKRVAVCTGGYTGQKLNPLLKKQDHADPVEFGGDAGADRCGTEGLQRQVRNLHDRTTPRCSTSTCSSWSSPKRLRRFAASDSAFCTSGIGCDEKL